jgi:uncharacterized membrane protein YoaK (UPF0700 family)
MLVNRAHTFIRQSRLVISLAWVAGFVNVVALFTCGQVVSHMTGNATALGSSIARSEWGVAALVAALLSAFFIGAFASGFAIELGRQRNWASIYVLPATLEVALLAVFAFGVQQHDIASPEHGARLWWMTVVATLSMGVQNATITRISSGVVRTTHLTGIVTDLGHESAQLVIVRWMFGRGVGDSAPDLRGPTFQRLVLLGSILASFVFGSACGALMYLEYPHWSMLPPIALLGLVVLADLRTPICEIEEALLAETARAETLPAGVSVFSAIPRGGDAGETHLPDLDTWISSLPSSKRTIVLDLTHVQVFGPLAASALHAMSLAAARTGRHVVVAGLDAGEVATVNALSRADLLHPGNCAEDLAEALAMVSRDEDAVLRPSEPSRP